MSNSLTFYEIDKQIFDLVDQESGEITNEEQFNALQLTKEQKIVNLGKFINFSVGELNQMEEAIKKVQEMARVKQNKIENIKKFLKNYMEQQGLTKIEHPMGSVSIRKNPPSLRIDEKTLNTIEGKAKEIESVLREEKAKIAQEKKRIKEDLLAGAEIEGATLEYNTSLTIK